MQGARGRRTRILLVPALYRREKGTKGATRIITYSKDLRGSDARDGGKLDRNQLFRHSRHEEAVRRRAGTQINEGISNNDTSLRTLRVEEYQKS